MTDLSCVRDPGRRLTGVSANYTLANGHDADGHVLRGNVKNTFNPAAFAEDGG